MHVYLFFLQWLRRRAKQPKLSESRRLACLHARINPTQPPSCIITATLLSVYVHYAAGLVQHCTAQYFLRAGLAMHPYGSMQMHAPCRPLCLSHLHTAACIRAQPACAWPTNQWCVTVPGSDRRRDSPAQLSAVPISQPSHPHQQGLSWLDLSVPHASHLGFLVLPHHHRLLWAASRCVEAHKETRDR